MSKAINYYEFLNAGPSIDELQALFKKNLSKFNMPYFESGSESETGFLRFCSSHGYQTNRKTILEYNPRCNDSDAPFLYLCLKDDRGRCVVDLEPDFIDMSRACPGGESFGICNRGAEQNGDVSISDGGTKVLMQYDFVVARFPFVPKLHFVSQRLEQIFRDARPTGCEIVRCNSDTPSFQMRIQAKTRMPVKVGSARISKRCPRCGAVKLMFSSEERYFRQGDLEEVDFQTCDRYETDNVGTFYIPNAFPIVSRRIFELLLQHDIQGVDRYTTDPPVRHAVVQIR